jgi:hypothetical protein
MDVMINQVVHYQCHWNQRNHGGWKRPRQQQSILQLSLHSVQEDVKKTKSTITSTHNSPAVAITHQRMIQWTNMVYQIVIAIDTLLQFPKDTVVRSSLSLTCNEHTVNEKQASGNIRFDETTLHESVNL